MFKRFGRFTARRPAVVALVSGGLMVALALGSLGMKIDYDEISQLPGGTESSRAIKDLQAGFPAGALNPTTVYVQSTDGTPLDPAALTTYAGKLREGATVSAESCRPARTAAWRC